MPGAPIPGFGLVETSDDGVTLGATSTEEHAPVTVRRIDLGDDPLSAMRFVVRARILESASERSGIWPMLQVGLLDKRTAYSVRPDLRPLAPASPTDSGAKEIPSTAHTLLPVIDAVAFTHSQGRTFGGIDRQGIAENAQGHPVIDVLASHVPTAASGAEARRRDVADLIGVCDVMAGRPPSPAVGNPDRVPSAAALAERVRSARRGSTHDAQSTAGQSFEASARRSKKWRRWMIGLSVLAAAALIGALWAAIDRTAEDGQSFEPMEQPAEG